MLPEFSLSGRKALITGGSKGLGFAMAEALAEAGADIVLSSRSAGDLESAASQLRKKTGCACVGVAADVTDSADVQRLVRESIAAMGGIDIVVNNAGINIRHPIIDQTEDEFRRIMDTNLTGTFLVSKYIGPHLLERRRGSVINVASMLGFVGLPQRPGYTASKGAVVQLTRTMALEWAPSNVRVNALCPGPIVTEINTPVLSDASANEYFVSRVPLGRWGQPNEVRGAAVFLASDASSFMTGATLVMDGGWTAQ